MRRLSDLSGGWLSTGDLSGQGGLRLARSPVWTEDIGTPPVPPPRDASASPQELPDWVSLTGCVQPAMHWQAAARAPVISTPSWPLGLHARFAARNEIRFCARRRCETFTRTGVHGDGA